MPMDDILLGCEEHMEKAVEFFHHEVRGIRTGRASPALVEHIKVDYYGSPTDLRQLATISAPSADLLMIKPFDPGSLKEIDRAIQASDLGITPMSDGKVIRLPIPALSTDRRKQLVASLKKMAEQARVTIRNVRRDFNKTADEEEKAGDMTEDQAKKCRDEIQKLTDQQGQKVEKILEDKNKEIMET
jgi:ribosome recycling factor